MRTALALALAYTLILAGTVLIVRGYMQAQPGVPYPNVRYVRTTPNPSPWIQRYADPTLAYRFACRVGVCGSCAMTVNGRPRWTCWGSQTRWRAIARDRELSANSVCVLSFLERITEKSGSRRRPNSQRAAADLCFRGAR